MKTPFDTMIGFDASSAFGLTKALGVTDGLASAMGRALGKNDSLMFDAKGILGEHARGGRLADAFDASSAVGVTKTLGAGLASVLGPELGRNDSLTLGKGIVAEHARGVGLGAFDASSAVGLTKTLGVAGGLASSMGPGLGKNDSLTLGAKGMLAEHACGVGLMGAFDASSAVGVSKTLGVAGGLASAMDRALGKNDSLTLGAKGMLAEHACGVGLMGAFDASSAVGVTKTLGVTDGLASAMGRALGKNDSLMFDTKGILAEHARGGRLADAFDASSAVGLTKTLGFAGGLTSAMGPVGKNDSFVLGKGILAEHARGTGVRGSNRYPPPMTMHFDGAAGVTSGGSAALAVATISTVPNNQNELADDEAGAALDVAEGSDLTCTLCGTKRPLSEVTASRTPEGEVLIHVTEPPFCKECVLRASDPEQGSAYSEACVRKLTRKPKLQAIRGEGRGDGIARAQLRLITFPAEF